MIAGKRCIFMIKIDLEKCIGCGMCSADCLAMNIEIKDGKASIKKECIQCGHCVAICPVGAVSIPEYEMEDVESCKGENSQLDSEQLLQSIKSRRSIRNYKQERVEQCKMELLAQAGRYTATAKNNQDCCFIFIQEELEQLKSMVWDYINGLEQQEKKTIARELLPFVAFNRRRKANPEDDFLFRNAPAVVFITSEWPLDAGLAAQNMETMAETLGLGTLYNGYLARIADANIELKKWLGIEDRTIKACMLLGYPDVHYVRTAPRKKANVIWK